MYFKILTRYSVLQVLCNLADQYALNEMYTEALNTYQLLTRNKLFPHANRLKVNRNILVIIFLFFNWSYRHRLNISYYVTIG